MELGRFRSWLTGRRALAVGVVALLLVGAGLTWRFGERVYWRLLLESPSAGRCHRELSRAQLQRSLALGAKYLLTHQKPEGTFDYEYDWRARELSADDNEVRQAGALWGVTLLYQRLRTPELAAAAQKGLAFFEQHSRSVGGVRCAAYPGARAGQMGTVALIALSYVEYLRAASALPAETRRHHEAQLDEYLEMLLQSVHPSGLWYGEYDVKSCKPRGEPSPYSDGEALLALTKAAKYLGRQQYVGPVTLAAAAGRRLNIQEARAREPDSDITKGYYQWSSMAFFEIATGDFPHGEEYGPVVIELADWMLDEHKVLTRLRNTGYAYEGIIHAYELAKRRGDAVHAAKFACAIDIGLQRLLGWQVGSPAPNRYTAGSDAVAAAVGGVQNEAFDSALRVDVTQHQMHATDLALEYVYK